MKVRVSSEDSVTSLLAAAGAIDSLSLNGTEFSESVTVYVPDVDTSETGIGSRDSELSVIVLPRETGDDEYDISAFLLRSIRKAIRKHSGRLRKLEEENARLKSNSGMARRNGYSTKDSWRLKLGENERLLKREAASKALLLDIEDAVDARCYKTFRREAGGSILVCIAVKTTRGVYILPPGAYWFRKLYDDEEPKDTDYYEIKERQIRGQRRLVYEKLESKKEERA